MSLTLFGLKCFCQSSTADDGSSDISVVRACGHGFHTYCLKGWWNSSQGQKQQCPNCRAGLPDHITSVRSSRHRDLPPFEASVKLWGVETRIMDRTGQVELGSDDQFTQTQGLGEMKAKGKGKMVVRDDEEEDEIEEADGTTVKAEGGDDARYEDMRKQWREAMNQVRDQRSEVDQMKVHARELEKRVGELEEQNDDLQIENEALNAELESLNADEFAAVVKDKEATEKDNDSLRKQNEKLEERNLKLHERNRAYRDEVKKLQRALELEGTGGSEKIAEMKKECDDRIAEFEDKLMHARAEKDRVVLVLEEVTATIDDEKKKAREAIDSSRRKIDETIESSKRKVDGYKKETDQAVADAKSQRDQVSQLRAANKQYSVKLNKLKEKLARLSSKKGRLEDSDEELDEAPPRGHESPARARARSASRQPLAATTSHNYGLIFGSPSPPPPTYRVRNRAIVSPVKDAFSQIQVGYDDDLGMHDGGDHEEDDIYAPDERSVKERNRDRGIVEDDEDEDDDIVIVESARPSRPNAASRPLSHSTSHDSITSKSTTTSRFFSSSNPSAATQPQPQPFPTLSNRSSTTTTLNRPGIGKKRDFERHKSDQHLPDFGRGIVETGPKRKIKRKV